jgi:hypothetical protein
MSPQAGFVLQGQVVPRLRSAIPNAVHCVGAEDAQELGIAMAAKLMHNVEAKGKQVTPGNIAYYTNTHIKSGGLSTGSSVVDVYGSGTQLKGNTQLDSLEMVVTSNEKTGGEIFELHDVLSNDQEDPGTKAARKMDWESFMSGLSAREQSVIECLVDCRSLRNAAKSFRVSDSTIQGDKRNWAVKIWEFMGFDILIQVCKSPRWKQDIQASRERLACKHERSH